MKELTIKYGGVLVIALVAVLLATNPTRADFRDYIAGTAHYSGLLTSLVSSATCDDVQTGNWYFFSNYERRCITETQACTGVFNTFFCGKTTAPSSATTASAP